MDVLINLRRFTQLKKWNELRAKSPSHNNGSLYLEWAVLISHWFQNTIETEHFTSSSDIECSIENIVQKVKQHFLSMENSKPSRKSDAINSVENARKLLNLINQVMFNELCFKLTDHDDGDNDDEYRYLCIDKV